METEDFIKVEATNFELVQSELGEMNRLLNELYLLSPMDSYIHLTFSKENELISGNIKIQSQKQLFESSTTQKDTDSCFLQLDKLIKIEIDIWKKNRFK